MRIWLYQGLPVQQPSKLPKLSYCRFGTDDKLIQLLHQSPDVVSKESHRMDVIYYDDEQNTYLQENKWCRVIDQEEVVFQRSKRKNADGASYEWVQEDQIDDMTGFAELKLVPLVSFVVDRTIYQFQSGAVLCIDLATFIDDDPHCVCTLVGADTLPSDMYKQLESHSICPVRSSVCEYLFRHRGDLYETLREKGFVDDVYEMSVLDSQWDRIQQNPKLDLIIHKIEGRDPNGISPWDDYDACLESIQ